MALRYDKSLNNEINKAVRNFNQKISRLEKSERDLILPERVSIRELKKVKNKWELNRKIKELQTFTKRGAEEIITTKAGVSIPKYELINFERERKRVYNKLSRNITKISNITPTVFGVRQDATYSQMGSQQLANMKARRKNIGTSKIENLNKEEFKKLKRIVEATASKERYQTEVFMNNYIDKMLFNLGYYVGYDKEKLNFIKENLLTLNERQFMNLFNTEEGIKAIRDYYPETHRRNINQINDTVGELYDALYENIESIVKDYKK